MIVEHCRQEIVCRCDGVEVAGEVQIDFLHRYDLGVTSTSRSAFDTETGTERRFTQGNHRSLADSVESIGKSYAGRCFSFAGGSRTDGGYENEFAVGFVLVAFENVEGDFGFVGAETFDLVGGESAFFGDCSNRQCFRLPGDFEIGKVGHELMDRERKKLSGWNGFPAVFYQFVFYQL